MQLEEFGLAPVPEEHYQLVRVEEEEEPAEHTEEECPEVEEGNQETTVSQMWQEGMFQKHLSKVSFVK